MMNKTARNKLAAIHSELECDVKTGDAAVGVSRSLLRMSGIGKSFNGNPALQHVEFVAYGGEIQALLGANGAGKSTLMKILSGAYSLDEGIIELNGQAIHIHAPADAKRLGIHCVYQEVDTALIPQLSVAENVMLDRLAYGTGSWWVKPSKIRMEAERACRELGVALPLHKRVGELSLADKQMVLIARTLVEQAKVVIFDEPTAPLSQEESETLFRVMRTMRDRGIIVIFITHRLPEVFAACDRVTVMRDGKLVYQELTRSSTQAHIVSEMLGRSFQEEFPKADAEIGNVVLEVSGLRLGNKVRGVDLTVKAGEIVGIVGLVGAGKTECARLIGGADQPEAGQFKIRGRKVSFRDPAQALAIGIAHIPEERRKQGIFVNESVRANLSLPILRKFAHFGCISRAGEQSWSKAVVERLGIKTASVENDVKYLSGGNQQKVSIGKWVETAADLYVFDEPTKGVDIGAKGDIFRLIGQLAQQGKGILYFTCEFSEAVGIADRTIVMCDGEFVKHFKRGEVTQEQLLFYASAGREENSKHEHGHQR
ncbi:sugar ABC transporter ATP-binding protein [Paenibacillus sp. ACRRX]|uniref:sugar ABC transporter ATP-binding protein n=1 Tax=Paenibacillus sp. ACRRX TaxID=2918206 RepID=UPI001EF5052D|nr:sugar ABC transporter ATP-binding protein [Paenibacillus sp. ACRRX]MCG7406441.1 sugar ABC transporter ATP-binding protein [Paenibacillus sp. ACRRX]